MPKFSLIVPVYNVEKYIEKCLESIKNQTFKNYEVIIVNDGSEDGSMDIANTYNYKVINQKNSGLSAARNRGVEDATGDYLLFIDSDDYIEPDLLETINKNLDNNPDIVRYQIREVYNDKEIDYNEEGFDNKTGVEAFKKIVEYHFVEPACCYVIKREFYQKDNFRFKEKAYHEDFGLIPLIIMKAKKVNSISYIGYNYVQRENSIMSSNDYDKKVKKVSDFYDHYLSLIREIDKTNLDSVYFKSFIANSLIIKVTELNNTDYKIYLRRLRKDKVFDNILTDTFIRKIKKIFVYISPKIFYNRKR